MKFIASFLQSLFFMVRDDAESAFPSVGRCHPKGDG